MALRISCPHCGTPHRLSDPYPQPGSELQCTGCGRALAITYPVGLVEKLRARGAHFEGETTSPTPVTPELEPHKLSYQGAPETEPTEQGAPELPQDAKTTPMASKHSTPEPSATQPRTATRKSATKRSPKKKKKKSWFRRMSMVCMAMIGFGFVSGVAVLLYFNNDLKDESGEPITLETLENYRPPTVTVVYDNDGLLLGEIYEQRRYVVELERIPEHVREAFIASEDANFYNHYGVDPVGIMRAMGRNFQQGEMAQGASTITQQVARNFLLTSEKKLSRKIKEAILAVRIEGTFTKEHILHLYLPQSLR